MQRLYSTFPNGRPGVGLLLLRLAAGSSLVAERISMVVPILASPQWEIHLVLLFIGVCICLGIWTPVVGALGAASEVWIMLSGPSQYQSHILIAVLTIALAMLGPGAWSVDALVFGRKRITI